MKARKIKLSTFLHRDLTEEQQGAPFFGALLTLLPHLYAAQMRPSPWTKPPGVEATIREQYLHQGFARFKAASRFFEEATRIEMQIGPPHYLWFLPDDCPMWVQFSITAYDGRVDLGRLMDAVYNLETGKIERYSAPG